MDIEQFRELFLKRLTIDSETQDKRRKEFNQAIFDKYEGWACFNGIDLEMIMDKFDLAMEAMELIERRLGKEEDDKNEIQSKQNKYLGR